MSKLLRRKTILVGDEQPADQRMARNDWLDRGWNGDGAETQEAMEGDRIEQALDAVDGVEVMIAHGVFLSMKRRNRPVAADAGTSSKLVRMRQHPCAFV